MGVVRAVEGCAGAGMKHGRASWDVCICYCMYLQSSTARWRMPGCGTSCLCFSRRRLQKLLNLGTYEPLTN